MRSRTTFHVGCQSWGYDDWITPIGGETVFYPIGTKRDEMLGLYASIFDTIEVDSTLYGVPPESTFRNWYDETPPGFSFSLKFPREVTHDLLLRGPSVAIADEFVQRSALLKEKLGVFLIQFPQSFEADERTSNDLRTFLDLLPSGYRFVVEFRHLSWFTDQTIDILNDANVGLCLVEGRWVDRQIMIDFAVRDSCSFRYLRIMGERDLIRFDKIYRDRSDIVARWAATLSGLKRDRVFVYSDNYFEGFAPATAGKFKGRLGLSSQDPATLEMQGSLF